MIDAIHEWDVQEFLKSQLRYIVVPKQRSKLETELELPDLGNLEKKVIDTNEEKSVIERKAEEKFLYDRDYYQLYIARYDAIHLDTRPIQKAVFF